MAADDEAIACDFCKRGRVTMRMEELALRQLSDKGYVHYRARIRIGTYDTCHSRSLGPGSGAALDAAFLREYDKLE
jgi:hypothetical protein